MIPVPICDGVLFDVANANGKNTVRLTYKESKLPIGTFFMSDTLLRTCYQSEIKLLIALRLHQLNIKLLGWENESSY